MFKSRKNISSVKKLYAKEYLVGFKDGFISTVTNEKILASSIAGSAVVCAGSIAMGEYKSAIKLSGITIGLAGIGNGMARGKKRVDDTKFGLYKFAAQRGVHIEDDAK